MSMDKKKKEFGKRLAEIRKSKGLNQNGFKDLIGAPTIQMVSGWETGRTFPSATYLIILAERLDISLDYLVLGKQTGERKRSFASYKDVADCICQMTESNLFSIFGYNESGATYKTILETRDKTIAAFKLEYDTLLAASRSLRPELFERAIIDLLNKYDIPLKKK